MLTRKEAIKELEEIMMCDLFSEYVFNILNDIITCLRAEDEFGFDVWGVRGYLGSDFYELLRDPEEVDDEVKAKLIAKYHRYNRWSGEGGA